VLPLILLGLALLVGLIFLAYWFASADPKKVIQVLKWSVITLVGGFLLYVIVRAHYGLLIALLPMLLAVLLQRRALKHRMKAARGPSRGQSSEVNTRFLRMTLDHDTGDMSGLILKGRFQGAYLDQLSAEDLLAFWRECRAEDAQSAAVLEAFLDRTQGEEWRRAAAGEAGDGPRPSAGGAMTEEEALNILGLEPGADKSEITEAHRRLMQKVHPDHGGSNYLAAKINEAKDLLLNN
jgi:hypothetical protein